MLRRAVRNVPQLHDERYARLDVLAPGKVDTAQCLEQGRLAVALVANNHDARRVDLALQRGERVDLFVSKSKPSVVCNSLLQVSAQGG